MAESRIAYEATSEVRDVISRIGRTEDIKLSPDNKRLAIVDYLDHKVFLFSIRIERTSGTPRIAIFDYSIISSVSLRNPHGVAFLDNDHIIVCNRDADVDVFRIPSGGTEWRERNVKRLKTINGKGMLLANVKSPGSVDCYEIADNCYRVLVCNNKWHMVTSHIIKIGNSIRIRNKGVLIENSLTIPDGISFSADHDRIAISNHVNGEVLIYKNTPELNRTTPPTAILRGIVCPHGVRFAPDGKRVFVADAASQYLHVFESKRGGLDGIQEPSKSIRLLDDETFYVGRYDSREGGIKGIDIDSSNTVLITTRRHEVIAFYDLNELLAKPSNLDRDEMVELCRQRDRSLEKQKSDVLKQQWTFRTRARHLRPAFTRRRWWRQHQKTVRLRVRMCHLYFRNRWSRETILDPSGPALSLTTHGYRLELVFYAIESIGLGSRKPSRITIWLDEEAYLDPPETLRRLKSRGLELHHSEDFGPHTKYYPYIDRERELHAPLVTADDDTLYPRGWLQQLIEAYEANPSVIHCHRARRMRLNNKRFMPYNEWGLSLNVSPSHLNLITGVSGVIYPPNFLQYLKDQGRAFEHCCPASDDIWLTVNALRGGFKIAQVKDGPVHFWTVPGSQKQRLFDANVLAGDNQYQLMRTFSETDLAKLRTHLLSEGGEWDLQPYPPDANRKTSRSSGGLKH